MRSVLSSCFCFHPGYLDVDECKLGLDNCHASATCTILVGHTHANVTMVTPDVAKLVQVRLRLLFQFGTKWINDTWAKNSTNALYIMLMTE